MLALIETTSPAHHWLRKVRHIAACGRGHDEGMGLASMRSGCLAALAAGGVWAVFRFAA